MPEGKMAVVNSFIAPLQPPCRHLGYTPAAEEEDISNFRAEGYSCTCEKQQGFFSNDRELEHQLRHTKSTESLSSLLKRLPEVVIPEPLYNPLPLQCLAASALPETVREEIDRVLEHYSAMSSSNSTSHLQSSADITGSGSPVLTGAENDSVAGGEEAFVRGDQAVNGEGEAVNGEGEQAVPGDVEAECLADETEETCTDSPEATEVRGVGPTFAQGLPPLIKRERLGYISTLSVINECEVLKGSLGF